MVAERPIPSGSNWSQFRIALIVLLILLVLAGAAWISTRPSAARHAIARRNFSAARWNAELYLRVRPRDADMNLLAGDAYFLDDSLDSLDAASAAIEHYLAVQGDNQQASNARAKAGRAAFLVLQEPSRAERYFLEAIALHADNFDAHYMLWQLYTVTERFFACEPHFRAAYQLAPQRDRPLLLRDWYFSQFSPLSAGGQLDYLMGFRTQDEPPSEEVAARRLNAFHEYELSEPNTAAALAQWHLRNLSREEALLVLEGITDHEAADRSFFYVGTLVEVLIEVGQVERADLEFQRWKGQAEGYFFERISGLHAQEVEGNLEKAEQAYRRAGSLWPGQTDWLLMNRHARCLALLGRKEDADRVNAEAARIEELTDIEVHRKVRESLLDLGYSENLEEVASFYEQFQRDWEASQWREFAAALLEKLPSQDGIPRRSR